MPGTARSPLIRMCATALCMLILLPSVPAPLASADDGDGTTGDSAVVQTADGPSGPEPVDAGATAVISTGSVSVDPGEEGTIQFRLDDVENVGALKIGFTFDTSVALVTAIVTGPLPVTAPGVAAVNAAGEYSASWFNAAPESGDFLIATFTFEAVGAPGAQTELEVVVTNLANSSGQELPRETQSGSFEIEMVYDFGDAPSPYPTTLAAEGAQHGIVPGFHLGSGLDWETNGQQSAHATGDDTAGDDDEDGVAFTSTISPDRTATVDVTASDSGYLDAWMDFNDDGDWADPGEQIFDSEELGPGVNELSFSAPLDAVLTDATFARFRFSSGGGLSYSGLAADGEVEDYEVAIEPVPPDPPTDLAGTAYSPSTVWLEWTRGIGADTTIITRDTAGYPSSPSEGTEVYSGPGTSCTDTGLDAGTLYYYTAWSYYSATGLDSDTAAHVEVTTLPAVRDWTFMVYMDADNSLEGADELDLAEMLSVGSSAHVSVIVQHDRYSGDGTWRYYVADGQLFVLDELDEQNMADPDTLSSFVDWAASEYPATKYALVLWDHGSGALGEPAPEGVIYDDTDLDFLSGPEMAAALAAAEQVDLLGFDACLMQMYEIVLETAAAGNTPAVIVGSEDMVPEEGWPYDAVLDFLTGTPGCTAAALAGEIVDDYMAEYPTSLPLMMSAVEPASASALTDTLDALAAALIASSRQGDVTAARAGAQAYTGDVYRDVIDFCDLVITNVDDCVTEAQALKDLVAGMVIAEDHTSGTAVDGSNGLSIYLPDTADGYDDDYDGLLTATGTWWDDFLRGGLDFGDAPDPAYPTLAVNDGARHALGGPHLGEGVDAEAEACPSGDACGDDMQHTDDEDGITFTTLLSIGHTARMEVIASEECMLDAWFDVNGDGDWADDGEQVYTSQPLVAGSNELTYDVPAGLVPVEGSSARFRVSSAGGLTTTGLAPDGEVEDYSIDILRLVEGDATRDYRSNIVDAMYVAQYTVGIRELNAAQLECADTNDDGVVNIVDAMHIAQYTVDPAGTAGVLFKPLWISADDPLTDAP
jgi:hypothetical protein